MNRIFFLLPAIFLSIAVTAQNKIDVLNYKYSIELNDNNYTIYGNDSIQLKIISATGSIKLDLVKKNEAGKGMVVDSISGPGLRGFVKNPESVQFMLTSNARPGLDDTVTYYIKYHGVPADGLIISKNKFGTPQRFAHTPILPDNFAQDTLNAAHI